eukprot:scaffold1798_cov117-Skeletonema_dohrnii-CCMP3373.AAC.1
MDELPSSDHLPYVAVTLMKYETRIQSLISVIPLYYRKQSKRATRCSRLSSCQHSIRYGVRVFGTNITNNNGPLKAVDYTTRSVRYDMVQSVARGHPKLDLIRSPTTV